MEIKSIRVFFYSLLFLLLVSCGGAGVEVTNPQRPGQSVPQSFRVQGVEVRVNIPGNWVYSIHGTTGPRPPADSFVDQDSRTVTEAYLYKGSSRVTLFTSPLDASASAESLSAFVLARHPGASFTVQEDRSDTPTMYLTGVDLTPGPRGGMFLDAFGATENFVVWMRMELVGSQEQIDTDFDELERLFNSVEIVE